MTTIQTPLLEFGPAGPEGIVLAQPTDTTHETGVDRQTILAAELRALADLAIGAPQVTRPDLITGSVLGTMLIHKRNLTEVAAELTSPRASIAQVVAVLEETGIVESLPGNFQANRPAYRFVGSQTTGTTETP